MRQCFLPIPYRIKVTSCNYSLRVLSTVLLKADNEKTDNIYGIIIRVVIVETKKKLMKCKIPC